MNYQATSRLAKYMPPSLAYIFQCVVKIYFMSKSIKPSRNKTSKKDSSPGKTSREIVKRHLSNKEDKITEEDFKNLKIDLSLPKDKAHRPLKIKPGKERPKDADKDNPITTPWDVISE